MSVVPKVAQGNGHWSLLFWRCHHLPLGLNKPLFLKKMELMHRLGGAAELKSWPRGAGLSSWSTHQGWTFIVHQFESGVLDGHSYRYSLAITGSFLE